MNINPKIEKIFSALKIDEKQIPIAYLQYFGTEDVYLTYYTWSERLSFSLTMIMMQRYASEL